MTYRNIIYLRQSDNPAVSPGVRMGEAIKRAQALLCLECGVCGAPAPDHLHFGGTARRSHYVCNEGTMNHS